MYNSEKYQKTHCLKFFNQLRRRKHFPITDVAKIVTHYLSFGRTRPEQWTKDRPHIQVAALADRMSRLKVGQTDRELDVTTDHDRRRRFGDRRLAFDLQVARRSSPLPPSTVVLVTSDYWSICLISSLDPSGRAATCAVCLSGSLFWASSAKQRTNQHIVACMLRTMTWSKNRMHPRSGNPDYAYGI